MEAEPKQKKEGEISQKSKSIKKQKVSKRSKRLDKLGENIEVEEKEKGVLYVGHLPYGFEETGLRKFFEQFGTIKRLKMSRSKKVYCTFHSIDCP